jgi:hypothetical protein
VGVALEGGFLEDEEAAVCHFVQLVWMCFVWSLFGLVRIIDNSTSWRVIRCDALCAW